MANLAAILPSAKTPLSVQSLPTPTPGPSELLIKNETIALNPVEYKVAKLGIFPHLKYPAVIGSTYGGTIAAIGTEVTGFKVGERIVVGQPKFGTEGGNEYRAYQRYVLLNVGGRDGDTVGQGVVTKAPDSVDLPILASIMMNALCVPGLFTGRLGLDRPDLDAPSTTPQPKKHNSKILIYGGSTSFGTLAIPYLSRAGYSVITTSSPPNHAFVSGLGAAIIIDHVTLSPDEIADTLISHGPYAYVVDMVSTPATIPLTAHVLAAQGGGKLYAMQPAFGAEELLPEGVERVFESWSNPLHEEGDGELLKWVVERYLPEGVSKGVITPMPVEMVEGGLRGIDGGLERLKRGVSGVRLVVDPWE